jgi:poly [ADP-ribose] polymerase
MSNQLVEHRKFVCTNVDANNNKFWEYELYAEGPDTFKMIVKRGRVGDDPVVYPPKIVSRKEVDSVVRSKTGRTGRAAYKEIEIISGTTGPTGPKSGSVSTHIVAQAAREQLAKNDPELVKLVDRLAKENKHQLVAQTGGKIDIDLETGMVTTAMGVVTKDTVDKARPLLDQLGGFTKSRDLDSTKRKDVLQEYLMYVPQIVGRKKGWHLEFLVNNAELQQQNQLLDQLAASADLALARAAQAAKSGTNQNVSSTPGLFEANIEIVSDLKDVKRIEAMFLKSMNSGHVSRHLRPKRVYSIDIPHMTKGYDGHGNKLDNRWELWHGTRVFNVLSILKSGFMVPPSGAAHVTGRMFGDGIYASDQSTKALNYAYGYWDGGAKDDNCFMFLVEFGMGRYFTPSYSTSHRPAGYDSIFAKAHASGVQNNEMIVPKVTQCKPKYLIEFSRDGR